ncbi:hypothetical protein RF11_10041 [Thelohanellus kitauei]|uniref:Uncharacterized protein n=1 Tax=Thelohanellus kitauei TaxID=669202 RepID=A0A0C2MAC4_THEKT|nr:hypothetical protein RF11_10041 [Thelohanellus kitauei]
MVAVYQIRITSSYFSGCLAEETLGTIVPRSNKSMHKKEECKSTGQATLAVFLINTTFSHISFTLSQSCMNDHRRNPWAIALNSKIFVIHYSFISLNQPDQFHYIIQLTFVINSYLQFYITSLVYRITFYPIKHFLWSMIPQSLTFQAYQNLD